MNTLARIRIKTGLTRPGLLELVGMRRGRLTLYTAPDDEIDPIVLLRAAEVSRAYDEWRIRILNNLSKFEDEQSLIAGTDAAHALGLTEVNLSQLRVRGEVKGVQVAPKQWLYRPSDLVEFVEGNSEFLKDDRRKRAPLTAAFVRFFRAKEREREKQVAAVA